MAAPSAFWDIGLSTLRAIASYEGLDLDGGETVFDLCWMLVKKLLKTDDEATMEILRNRIGTLDAQCEGADFLLDMDIELGHLDKNEAEELTDCTAKLSRDRDARTEFFEAWNQKKESISAGAGKGAAAQAKFAKYPPLPADNPTQKEAKQWLPPDKVSVWRGLASGSWQVHYHGVGYRTFPWNKYGGGLEALLHLLRWTWEQYLELNSVPFTMCPVKLLFPTHVLPEAGAAKGKAPKPKGRPAKKAKGPG